MSLINQETISQGEQDVTHAEAGSHRVELPTGVISVSVHEPLLPLHSLCGFAARQNPKRGFLFVSKVLGKHIPVRPSLMLTVQERLTSQIPAYLPGPVVVIGMAETATCLGQGVFEAYKAMTGREDVLFIPSTRYRLNHPVALQFLEEHCHAADHIMYLPENERARALFEQARSLILVDDEASTGKTFVNLATAFCRRINSIERLVTAVITDWRGPERTERSQADMPVQCNTVALLKGVYQFQAAASLRAMQMPHAVGNHACKNHLLARNHGRLGTTEHFQLPAQLVSQAKELVEEAAGKPVLVLGTGEFSFPPFRLALYMEELGADVVFQTTTRSPIIADAGTAIACGFSFADNYEDGIRNYLYNVEKEQYGLVVLVHETPAYTIAEALRDELAVRLVEI